MTNKKKIFLIIASVIAVIVIAGGIVLFEKVAGTHFFRKNSSGEQAPEVKNYFYQNKDLGFSLELPPEFMYFQTQRKKGEDFIDLEIFVPTSDVDYPQEVQSYGKPIVVRIFNSREAWNKIDEAEKTSFYREIGEKKGKVYTLKIWNDLPLDWQGKWTSEMEENIVKLFKIL